MKVSELIGQLHRYPGDCEVIMSKDGEGNGFSPLSDIEVGVYVPYSTWSGEVRVGRELTSDLIEDGYSEDDMYDGDDGQDCITLWPTN